MLPEKWEQTKGHILDSFSDVEISEQELQDPEVGKKEIVVFESACEKVLEYLFSVYEIKPSAQKRYRVRSMRGKYPRSMPYKNYDSLAEEGQIRTLIKPLPIPPDQEIR